MKNVPLKDIKIDKLNVHIYETNEIMGKAAAKEAAASINNAISTKGIANVMLATGNSQLSFLNELRNIKDVYWPGVNIFHLDEYIDLPLGHPAGFSFYLRNNILSYIDVNAFFPVPGHPRNIQIACKAYEYLLRAHPIDVCCVGIGENGHIAFNEPSVADFEDPVWVKAIELEEASRHQQIGEGYFKSLKDVPTRAITVTIPGIIAAKRILCIVPEKRKAKAIYWTLNEKISTKYPATILRETDNTLLFLDEDSASELKFD